jgi:hypothetical protein
MQCHVSNQQHLKVLTYFATAIFTLLSENHNQGRHIVGVKAVNPLQGMNPSNYNCCLQQQPIRVIVLTIHLNFQF